MDKKTDEIVAREVYKNRENKLVYEYRIGYAPMEGAPHLKYRIEVRTARPDGPTSDWDSAYMGHALTREAALHRFVERYSRNPDLTLDISNDVIRSDFDKMQKSDDEQKRKRDADDKERAVAQRAAREREAQIHEQFSGVKFRTEKTKIASAEGTSLPDEEGLSLGGLTITDNGKGKFKTYQVTHQQSGLLVADDFKTLKNAKMAVWRLTQIMDWNRPQDVLIKDIPKGLKLFMKQMREDPYVEYPDDLKDALEKDTKLVGKWSSTPPSVAIPPMSDAETMLLSRAAEGSLSAYSTVHMTEDEKKTLKRLVRQEKLLKLEMPMYSGPGNRYQYVLPFPKSASSEQSTLSSIHNSRSPRSREADERLSNSLTVSPDDPRVDRWKRDPGSMDVEGVDTPKTKYKPSRKTRKKTRSRKSGGDSLGTTRR